MIKTFCDICKREYDTDKCRNNKLPWGIIKLIRANDICKNCDSLIYEEVKRQESKREKNIKDFVSVLRDAFSL